MSKRQSSELSVATAGSDVESPLASTAARPDGPADDLASRWRTRGGLAVGYLLIATGLILIVVSCLLLRTPQRPASNWQNEQTVLVARYQAHDHCSPPARTKATPSLFCWTMMMPDGAEQTLLRSQLQGFAGIFACNDYAVISRKAIRLGKDECDRDVMTWFVDMPATLEKGVYGVNAETNSWLNSGVFQDAWAALIGSSKLWPHDFVAKADADAVFFPDILRNSVQPHVNDTAFFTNCRFWGGDPVGKLFGALEVLSHNAVWTYHQNNLTCHNLPWQRWGEDMWMEKCMQALSVSAVGLFDQVSDSDCPLGGGASCAEKGKVILHPYKDAASWWSCWKEAEQ